MGSRRNDNVPIFIRLHIVPFRSIVSIYYGRGIKQSLQ